MKRLAEPFAALSRRAWLLGNRDRFREQADRRPRVYVDVSVIARHDARTGIQRVVRAMWFELSRRQHPSHDFVPVYAGTRHGYRLARWNADDVRARLTAELVAARPGDRFVGLDLAAHYLPLWSDQLDDWRAAGLTTHFVVYDLLPLEQPGWFQDKSVRHFRRWFDTVRKCSDSLLCISDTVAQQVRDRIGATLRPRIGRLQLSGDLFHSRPTAGVSGDVAATLATMSQRPTLLMVGTVEPRKGHADALAAMERLWADNSDGPALLIIGKPGWMTDELQEQIRCHAEFGRRLHWLEGASDEALEIAYARAAALLLPTHSEGFGLPLVEATRHSKWVLARDLPVFREQGLTNVRYFSGDRPDQLASAMQEILALSRGSVPPTQAMLSWADCADRLLVEIGVDAAPLAAPVKQASQPRIAAR